MIAHSQIDPKLAQLTLEKLSQAPYFSEQLNMQDNIHTRRRTYSFGYNYFSMANENFHFTHIPSFMKTLCQACIDSFAGKLKMSKAEDYQNVIVSIYEPGFKLEPHIDVDDERFAEGHEVKFQFGEDILGVVLEADEKGRLYFVKTEDEAKRLTCKKIFELDEQTGTTYMMHGAYRHKPYYHGVSAVKKSRISVTFRTVTIDEAN